MTLTSCGRKCYPLNKNLEKQIVWFTSRVRTQFPFRMTNWNIWFFFRCAHARSATFKIAETNWINAERSHIECSGSEIFNCKTKWQKSAIKKRFTPLHRVRSVSDNGGNAPRNRFCANDTRIAANKKLKWERQQQCIGNGSTNVDKPSVNVGNAFTWRSHHHSHCRCHRHHRCRRDRCRCLRSSLSLFQFLLTRFLRFFSSCIFMHSAIEKTG